MFKKPGKTTNGFENKIPLSVKTQVLGENLLPSKKKRVTVHTKNPYKIKKDDPFKDLAKPEKTLDGFYILEKSGCELPHEVISIRLANKNIVDVAESDMRYFVNLSKADLSENHIKNIRKLSGLQGLNKLEIQNNGIEEINFQDRDAIESLEEIDLAFNIIRFSTIKNLNVHPNLKVLNLAGNELTELPDDLSGFINLEVLNISCNRFESNNKAARLWSALASIPKLKDLDISRNFLRGIHTEKLIPGNFNKLERLDFSYNRSENQHNLICTRNFKSLKMLIVTGNPFAFFSQHKGLEREIFMRVGAILINDNVELPYLKNDKRKSKLPIKFPNLYTLQPDNLKSKSKPTFFGVELPPEDEVESVQKEKDDVPDETEEEEEFDQARFFVTEAQNQGNKKSKDLHQGSEYQNQDNQEDGDKFDDQRIEEAKDEGSNEFREVLASNLENISSIDDFKKVANQMIGDSQEYEKPLDINTAYKLLRQMVKKPDFSTQQVEALLNKTAKKDSNKSFPKGRKPGVAEARMAGVEMLIDKLNKKMSG